VNACWLLNRTAFKKALQISSGGVCRADQMELHRLLPVYKPKQREGVIERVEADGCTAVCRHAMITVGNTCTFGAALFVCPCHPTYLLIPLACLCAGACFKKKQTSRCLQVLARVGAIPAHLELDHCEGCSPSCGLAT
jgi:hypothetical protein